MTARVVPPELNRPRAVRIVEAFGPSRRQDNREAAAVLRTAISALQGHLDHPAEFLSCCGGFLLCEWPNNVTVADIRKPKRADLQQLVLAARLEAERFVRPFKKRLMAVSRFVSFGVDCRDATDTRSAELVVVYDVQRDSIVVTGKTNPTGAQERRVVCFPVRSHLMELDGQRVLTLGCHDLNLFNNRALATAKPNGFRALQIEAMRRAVGRFSPSIVLHHPHYTDSARIWAGALGVLRRELRDSATYSSAGRWWRPNGRQRMQLADCLRRTASEDVLSVVVKTL